MRNRKINKLSFACFLLFGLLLATYIIARNIASHKEKNHASHNNNWDKTLNILAITNAMYDVNIELNNEADLLQLIGDFTKGSTTEREIGCSDVQNILNRGYDSVSYSAHADLLQILVLQRLLGLNVKHIGRIERDRIGTGYNTMMSGYNINTEMILSKEQIDSRAHKCSAININLYIKNDNSLVKAYHFGDVRDIRQINEFDIEQLHLYQALMTESSFLSNTNIELIKNIFQLSFSKNKTTIFILNFCDICQQYASANSKYIRENIIPNTRLIFGGASDYLHLFETDSISNVAKQILKQKHLTALIILNKWSFVVINNGKMIHCSLSKAANLISDEYLRNGVYSGIIYSNLNGYNIEHGVEIAHNFGQAITYRAYNSDKFDKSIDIVTAESEFKRIFQLYK